MNAKVLQGRHPAQQLSVVAHDERRVAAMPGDACARRLREPGSRQGKEAAACETSGVIPAGSVTRNLLTARHAANDARVASIAGAPRRRADSAGSHIRQGMMGVSARASTRAAQWLIGDI
ncbi:hypothetical protein L2Y90_09135 [Burkholderia pyrrocinia]|uniref:hypothetical protein n=1 Tax=Burkholderia pyrrocinia TaxID=60550 RepID=UPI00215AB0DA|nr:hypothetical protein [Burkholderia pyrrocinia]UVE64030.1 hypothetical protein L2Y90_09135 [Burkholderia pyrrocinia]